MERELEVLSIIVVTDDFERVSTFPWPTTYRLPQHSPLVHAGMHCFSSELIRVYVRQVLVEDRQVRPDGAVRHREMLLSEKLIPGETWRDAVDRAIAEELGSALEGPRAQYELFPETYRHVSLPSGCMGT